MNSHLWHDKYPLPPGFSLRHKLQKQAKWPFTMIKSHVPLWLRVHVHVFLLFVLALLSFIVRIIGCSNALKSAGMHAPNMHGWLNWCNVYSSFFSFFAGLFILDTPVIHYMFCRWICVPFLCHRRHILDPFTGAEWWTRVAVAPPVADTQ